MTTTTIEADLTTALSFDDTRAAARTHGCDGCCTKPEEKR